MSTTITLLSLLLILPLLTTTTPLIPGLDTFLTQQFRLDPHASNDTLPLLPSRLLPTTSSFPPPSSLSSLTLPISLHIILVGPTFTPTSPSTLSTFLSHSLSSPSPFHLTTHNHNHNHLSLHHLLHHHTSLSPPSLHSSLSSTLHHHLSSSPSSLRSPLISLPFSLIDSLISSHYLLHHKSDPYSYTLFILNLGPHPKPYAYSYSSSSSSPGAESSSPSFTRCLGSIYQSHHRYLWVDLSAGPIDYGPGLSGDGLASFPHSSSSKSERALLADIASVVDSAYHALLAPPLRILTQFENHLVVNFIHIVDEGRGGGDLDWGLIERSLTADEGLLFSDQSLSFNNYAINYKQCGLCSFAVSKAVASYTSRFLFDNYTMIVSDYLDSKKLHQVLAENADEFKRLAGVNNEEEDFNKRVINVYVFDLDLSLLLMLDRFHQAVAFKDMVIAVRTRNTQTVSDYTCNGRHVFTQTRELERPIVGSVLQSMWGVSPTHLKWSSERNSTLVDYTWSVGQTPFGPFSEMLSLSFVQKDAAKRNVLLTSLNYTVSSAVEVLESVKAHSGGGGKLLKGKQANEFSQRWFLFKYKIDKMISALSHLEFDLASYYLRSSEHDLYAMHSIVYHASQEIEASLVCFNDPPVPWGSMSMSVVVFFLLCFAFAKRDKLFSNKRKQF